MALTQMYEGKNNSPQTALSANITADDSVIPVSDISVFPSAPNLATIGNDDNAEVIRYTGISGSTLTNCERGFGGTTKKSWDAETVISRQITKYDFDAIQSNITELNNAKQDTLTFDTAPTAGSENPVTSGGVKTALEGKANSNVADSLNERYTNSVDWINNSDLDNYRTSGMYNFGTNNANSPSNWGQLFVVAPRNDQVNQIYFCDGKVWTREYKNGRDIQWTTWVPFSSIYYFYQQPTSVTSASTAEFCRVSDSRITPATIVLNCEFTVPSAITSNVTWTTAAGYISLKGICTSSTCKVNLVLGQKGN